ncbi:hypothetical protein [Chryseobacterium sp. 3008163]|uniref:hypothetical protein n=1 Tax=Chryseobacterium sp. 3008163 TaxID=2478663 RepID=UPI000F0CAB98|nr:hypothetical protein [Chryseobacterium sp. 3008163]AYN00246.1 hypothetical protein EAG08_07830 [Chryseobacterium sp. 3008163]
MSLIANIKSDAKQKFPLIYSANNNLVKTFLFRLYSFNFKMLFFVYCLIIIIIIFYTLFIDFGFLKILNINFEDAIKTFTTTVITLVSMNLFVTNLLLTHLKDERDDLQSIIDKRVNFKFITYLGFSIIISILILYFLSPSITNPEIKSNILIFIFSTFIIYIIFLISLYNNVFNFIHKSKRNEIIKSELELEFDRAFYNNFLKKEFKTRYIEFIQNSGFVRYNSFAPLNDNLVAIYKAGKNDRFLCDINTDKLKNMLVKIVDEKNIMKL